MARQICLRMLTAAPRTRAQLATALARRGVPDEVAEAVLDRFAEVQLIDDAMFARAWVESRHHGRGLARRALAAELRQRGVETDDIQAAVSDLDPEQEYATARALIERRLAGTRGLARPARFRRLMGMLARKGYPEGLAYRVVREALEYEPGDFEAEPGSATGLEQRPAFEPDGSVAQPTKRVAELRGAVAGDFRERLPHLPKSLSALNLTAARFSPRRADQRCEKHEITTPGDPAAGAAGTVGGYESNGTTNGQEPDRSTGRRVGLTRRWELRGRSRQDRSCQSRQAWRLCQCSLGYGDPAEPDRTGRLLSYRDLAQPDPGGPGRPRWAGRLPVIGRWPRWPPIGIGVRSGPWARPVRQAVPLVPVWVTATPRRSARSTPR